MTTRDEMRCGQVFVISMVFFKKKIPHIATGGGELGTELGHATKCA